MFTRRVLLCCVAALALLAVAVTAGKPQPPPPPPPPPDPAILFTRGGDTWVENIDGSNQTPVITYATHGLYTGGSGRWSGDNTRIVFSARLDPAGGLNNLYMCNIDGSNVRNVLEADMGALLLNPKLLLAPLPGQPAGDEWIIFEWNGTDALWAIRTDGTGRNRQPGLQNAIRLTSESLGFGVLSAYPSNDGTFLALWGIRWTGGGNHMDDSYRADLGIDENGELFITGVTSLTKVPGSPLEYADLVRGGVINPSDEQVAVDVYDPVGTLGGGWLIPLDNPAGAWRPLTSAPLDRWLNPECVVRVITKKGKERGDYLYRSNVFTGEETMLFKFEDQTNHRPRRWRPSP